MLKYLLLLLLSCSSVADSGLEDCPPQIENVCWEIEDQLIPGGSTEFRIYEGEIHIRAANGNTALTEIECEGPNHYRAPGYGHAYAWPNEDFTELEVEAHWNLITRSGTAHLCED